MACFIVPATEAIVTTVASKKLNHTLETKEDTLGNYYTKNMKTLNTMLWGGSALLLFEHIWHGEVTPFFPFFTAVWTSRRRQCPLRRYQLICPRRKRLHRAWSGK